MKKSVKLVGRQEFCLLGVSVDGRQYWYCPQQTVVQIIDEDDVMLISVVELFSEPEPNDVEWFPYLMELNPFDTFEEILIAFYLNNITELTHRIENSVDMYSTKGLEYVRSTLNSQLLNILKP